MTDLSVPSTFSSGSSIIAADMNANFDAVETMINTTGVPKLQDGAVSSTAKLADGVVTHAKMDSKTLGQQVSGGYDQEVSDSSTAGDKLSITVTGDGANPMLVTVDAETTNSSAAMNTLEVWSGAGGTGTRYGKRSIFIDSAGVGLAHAHGISVLVPAFSGSVTLYARLTASTGTPTLKAASTAKATMRATWAPGYSNS